MLHSIASTGILMGALVLVLGVEGNSQSPFFDHATKECTAPVWHPTLGGHKQTVLVTGAGGFIASHVARHCQNYGMNVIAVDDLSGGFTANIPAGITFVQGDLKDPEFVAALFSKYEFDFVYHLAAYAAEGLSHFIRSYNYRNNLVATIELINQSIKHKVKTFVFTSSIAVYGAGQTPMTEDQQPRPEDPYGISKYAIELDLEAAKNMFGMDYIIMRPHNVYGPNQNMYDKYRNVVGIFLNQRMRGEKMSIFGDGEQKRAFSYVDDVAPIIAMAPLVEEAKNQVFNVGADTAYTVNQLAVAVSMALGEGNKPDIIYHEKRKEVEEAHSDHSKTRCFFNPHPATNLDVGMGHMVSWMRKYAKAMSPVEFTDVEILENLPPSWKTPNMGEVPRIQHLGDDKDKYCSVWQAAYTEKGQKWCSKTEQPNVNIGRDVFGRN